VKILNEVIFNERVGKDKAFDCGPICAGKDICKNIFDFKQVLKDSSV
jgi:hypothetical protein